MKLSTLKKRLKGFGRVSNLISDRSGREVSNQFEISFDNGYLFQSYSSIIAIQHKGTTYLTDDYDYSVTTMKYLKQFLGHGIKETRELLKSGSYKLLK